MISNNLKTRAANNSWVTYTLQPIDLLIARALPGKAFFLPILQLQKDFLGIWYQKIANNEKSGPTISTLYQILYQDYSKPAIDLTGPFEVNKKL